MSRKSGHRFSEKGMRQRKKPADVPEKWTPVSEKGICAGEGKGLAAASLGQMRRIVAINLVLGVITVAAGASGRFWA